MTRPEAATDDPRFMPLGGDRCDVVRIVQGLEGEVPVEMLLDVRFGYGDEGRAMLPHRPAWATRPQAFSYLALIFTARLIDAVSHGREPWPLRRGEAAAQATH
jgi:hypothetical protein